jgi:S1-C subfamily serine protease
MVHAVDPGAWGDRLGLQRGDILVDVGGAPVFGYAELWAVTRMTQPGAEMAAAWVRDRALHRATATLGPWPARMVAS